ncbi:hypothetical protein AB0J38_22560 [Streptomyces sp. NPDC050095]|uniref:hypothetical protein n=1 Tax=unclassified Streptomyces TaxID=2593676 RepID=UPI00343276B4
MRGNMNRNMKQYALGVAVVAALSVTTACGPSEDDGKAGSSASPSASASAPTSASPSASAPDKTGTPAPIKSGEANSGGGNGGSSGGDDKGDWDYADRQTPPTGSVCDHGGQGPYGSIESVNMGGESPFPVFGVVLGMYECGAEGPKFVPSSATGAATNVLVDDIHLKVVVGGKLASDLGTKTPKANAFIDQLVKMEDSGELKGPKAPQFYFRIDAQSDDVNSMPEDDSHIIYLYQIIDGD